MATTMTSTTIVPFLFLATTVLLFFGTTDAQICYGRYGSANRFSLNQGQCRYAIGGIRRIRGVFIKSYMSCCRRPQAEGWGYHYSCKPCNAIRGQLRPWSQWSPCSRSCGMGRQTRSRVCTTNVCVGMRQKQVVETRACSWNACCPVDGGWSQWSQSTGCSVTCGPGFEYRIRSCKAPTPECGGLPCVGTGKQYKECFVNCATWAQWTTQGSCSRSCGNGTMLRQRECIRPFGGVCQGPPVDNVACNNGPCPKSGNWCPWSSWGKCSSNCTELQNTMKRTRSCSCPSPGFLGLPCQGPEVESMPCQGEEICSYDGNWNSWSGWSGCSAITCSVRKGRRVRKRVCDNPAPYLNGADCFGDAFQESTCLNMTECYVDGMTDNWSAWSPCSTSCGSCGKVSRWRKCVSPFRNPAVWAVQAVIGNPRLSCGKELMNETKDCTFITCPDGVDPCAPTTTPPPSSTLPTAVYIKSNEVIGAVVRSTPSSSTPGGRQTLRNKNIILHGGAYMTSSQQQVYTTTRAELETKSEEVVSDGRWDDNEVSLLAQLIKSTLRSPDIYVDVDASRKREAESSDVVVLEDGSSIPNVEDETPVVLESSDSLDPDVFDRHHLDLSQQLEQITNEKELGEFFTEYFASSKVIRSVTEHDQAFYESPIYSGSSDHKSKEDYGSEINYESKDSSYGDYDMKEKSDRDYITESLDSDSDTKGYVSEMTTYDDPKESPDSDEEYGGDYGNNGNYGNTAERSWYSYNEENYEAEEDPGFQVDENNKDLGEVNCMLQSIDDDYTPEINRCCLLLSKNVTNTTDMQKFDHCLVLQMEIGYGAGPEDVQKRWMGDVAERNKCVVRNNKRALLTFCCHKKSCREWSKPVLRKTCKACRPICPPCFSKILYG